jgi:hypothetical protein
MARMYVCTYELTAFLFECEGAASLEQNVHSKCQFFLHYKTPFQHSAMTHVNTYGGVHTIVMVSTGQAYILYVCTSASKLMRT